MGMKYVLDTNIVLYHLSGRLAEALPAGQFLVSIITEIELLSFPALDESGMAQIRALLAEVSVIDLSKPIANCTIDLRREQRLKIPDAVIAATAITEGAELLTNDAELKSVRGLTVRSLTLGS